MGRGGVGVFDRAIVRKHQHPLAQGVEHGLHEVTLALKAPGQDGEVLRVEVIDAAQDAIERTGTTTAHRFASLAATSATSRRATSALDAGPS